MLRKGTACFAPKDPVTKQRLPALFPVIKQGSLMDYRVKQVDEKNYFRYVLTEKNPH